jgi:hypothetical protein
MGSKEWLLILGSRFMIQGEQAYFIVKGKERRGRGY